MPVGVAFADPYTGETYRITNSESLAAMVLLVQGTMSDYEYAHYFADMPRNETAMVVREILAANGITVKPVHEGNE